MLPTQLGFSSTTLILFLTHAKDQKRQFTDSSECSLTYNKAPLKCQPNTVLGYQYIPLFPFASGMTKRWLYRTNSMYWLISYLKGVFPTHSNAFHYSTAINHYRVFSCARHCVKHHTSFPSLSAPPILPSWEENATSGVKQGTEACTASEWPSWNLNPGCLTPQLKCVSNTLGGLIWLVT